MFERVNGCSENLIAAYFIYVNGNLNEAGEKNY